MTYNDTISYSEAGITYNQEDIPTYPLTPLDISFLYQTISVSSTIIDADSVKQTIGA